MKTIFIFLIAGLLSVEVFAETFSFKEEEVVFFNGNIKITGTLFIPAAKQKLPAIAATHGSGKEGRKSAGNRSFAMQLAKEGYIVLIFDKRGVGDAGGEYVETPDMNVPAGDLIEAVKFLKSRKEVEVSKIGVYGHSQGGWIAPLAAIICRDIKFVIVTCGGAISIREQVLYNRSTELRKEGYPDSIVNRIISFAGKLYTYLGSGDGYGAVNTEYTAVAKQPWFSFFKQMGFSDQLPPPSYLSNPALNYFKMLNYDPQSTLRALDVPILVALGEKDETIPTSVCKRKWQESIKAGGHESQLTIEVLPNEVHSSWERNGNDIIYKLSYVKEIIKWLKVKMPSSF